jgi:hypothetical protein
MFEESLEKPWSKRLFGPIADIGDAEYLAGGLGWALVVIGSIQSVVAVVALPQALFGGVVLIVLGLLIWRTKSRAAATAALAVQATNLALMALTYARGRFGGNLLLALVLLWVALRAVQATFAYQKLRRAGPGVPPQVPA